MISRRAEEVLNRAGRYAFEKRHEYCTLEHVLWSLLEESEIAEVVDACGADADELRHELEKHLETEIPKASMVKRDGGEELPEPPVATLAIQRMIQRAVFHIQSSGKDEVLPKDLLTALYQATDSYAVKLLQGRGIERLDVLNYLSHGIRKDGSVADDPASDSAANDSGATLKEAESESEGGFLINLNQWAREGRIDPLVGRNVELERVIQTLCRRRKNNPLLVGEAGVGKTAIAEGLALAIVADEIPDLLVDAEVYALDLGSLLAGARFRGDFENRLKKVIASLQKRRAFGKMPILFIDEIHTIVGAGSVSGSSLDAANLLKPILSRGEIRCMGSTTYTEYRNIFEKDSALARRFQKIEISEPSNEDTIKILKGLRSKFEDHHDLKITDDAIRAAVDLSTKHLPERFLPDKAIDLIDEAGARARIKGKESVSAADIEEVVAAIAKIPARSVATDQKVRLKTLDQDLKLSIFGQAHAIDALVTAIRLARSGLRAPDKPTGSFLFCGPTGVGKTELAKQLAHCLGVPFLRFDMSEYMEKHTVSRLIGAPPGYVGFEQAGMLTEQVRKNPYSVVLLDEIEKAHTDVWNILLQVMDHGTLTDNYGRKADFRNVILIMTSNVGARELERKPLGLATAKAAYAQSQGVMQKEVEKAFSPEFRNRLDSIVYFNPLDPITIAQIVGKQLAELESQLLARNVELVVEEDVRVWLGDKGYDPVMGARPMARLIQEKIRKPLSLEILFGELEKGGTVRIVMENDEPKLFVNPRTGEDPELENERVGLKTHPDG